MRSVNATSVLCSPHTHNYITAKLIRHFFQVLPCDVFIDIKKVGALNVCKTSPTLELGAGMSIYEVMKTLESVAATNSDYFYGNAVVKHLKKVSNLL